MKILFAMFSCMPLSYVGRDRNCSSPHLISQSIDFMAREHPRYTIHFLYQIHTCLPHSKVAKAVYSGGSPFFITRACHICLPLSSPFPPPPPFLFPFSAPRPHPLSLSLS